MTRPKSVLDRIAKLLQDRPDIRLLDQTDQHLTGVQLRRVWEKIVMQPGHGMMRHENERWAYHGQAFVIEEMRRDRKGKPDVDQQVRLAHLAAVGTVCIAAEDVSDVINALGTVPGEIGDMLKRALK